MLIRLSLTVLGMVAAMLGEAFAAVQEKPVDYAQGGITFKGMYYYDDAVTGKRPGVIVIHEWWGLNEHARERARKLAEEGYAAFALDMYGEGKTADNADEASTWAGAIRQDPLLARARFDAAIKAMSEQPQTDPTKVASIGFCFGGTISLHMARLGADINGVVSFHGGLDPVLPAKPGNVKAKILVCHGAVDPFVPQESVAAFQQEMEKVGADYQLIAYSGAVHSFTSRESDTRGMEGVAYNEAADKRSWQAMLAFFKEIFS